MSSLLKWNYHSPIYLEVYCDDEIKWIPCLSLFWGTIRTTFNLFSAPPPPTWLQASEDTLHCTHLFLERLQGIFSKKMSLRSYRGGPEQSVTGPESFSLCSIHLWWEREELLTELSLQAAEPWGCLPVYSPVLHLLPSTQAISWDDWEKAEVFLAWRGWIRSHCHHVNMVGPFPLQPSTPCRAKPPVRLSFALTFGCQLRAPRALHREIWDRRFSSRPDTMASNLQFREKKAY